MTANTIAYGNLLESQRHNLEVERVNLFSAQEAARHNKENEAIGWFNGQEQARHNVQGEQISWFNAYEGRRTNQANEQIRRDELAELNRNNVVRSAEQMRSDLEDEAIARDKLAADARLRQAEIDQNRERTLWNAYTSIYNTDISGNVSRQNTQETNEANIKRTIIEQVGRIMASVNDSTAKMSQRPNYTY